MGRYIKVATLVYTNNGVICMETTTLRAFLATVDIILFDTLVAAEDGRMRVKLKRTGSPIGERNTLIAAYAKAIGLTFATNNTRDLKYVHLKYSCIGHGAGIIPRSAIISLNTVPYYVLSRRISR